jgi:hypothetical protein
MRTLVAVALLGCAKQAPAAPSSASVEGHWFLDDARDRWIVDITSDTIALRPAFSDGADLRGAVSRDGSVVTVRLDNLLMHAVPQGANTLVLWDVRRQDAAIARRIAAVPADLVGTWSTRGTVAVVSSAGDVATLQVGAMRLRGVPLAAADGLTWAMEEGPDLLVTARVDGGWVIAPDNGGDALVLFRGDRPAWIPPAGTADVVPAPGYLADPSLAKPLLKKMHAQLRAAVQSKHREQTAALVEKCLGAIEAGRFNPAKFQAFAGAFDAAIADGRITGSEAADLEAKSPIAP